jgi:hypothetical protein
MVEPHPPREVRRRLAILQHAEDVSGNVSMTCRQSGASLSGWAKCSCQPSCQPSCSAKRA